MTMSLNLCEHTSWQHMFWLRNKKNNFPVLTLTWRPGLQCADISSQRSSRKSTAKEGLQSSRRGYKSEGSQSGNKSAK